MSRNGVLHTQKSNLVATVSAHISAFGSTRVSPGSVLAANLSLSYRRLFMIIMIIIHKERFPKMNNIRQM